MNSLRFAASIALFAAVTLGLAAQASTQSSKNAITRTSVLAADPGGQYPPPPPPPDPVI